MKVKHLRFPVSGGNLSPYMLPAALFTLLHCSHSPSATAVCHNVLLVHRQAHAHTHIISKKISHLYHSAIVAGIEGASILNHTVFRNMLPSNPKTAVIFEARRDKIF